MRIPRPFLGIFCALVPTAFTAMGNPVGGVVVPGSGAASFSSSLGNLTINQTTPKVVINWQDFSIRAGEVTRFVQPSAGAAALNRVVTDNPSHIFGTLQANGSVYLINQNGILVGRSGQINVGTFLGSTLDLGPDQESANASFLAGAGLRLSGNSTAAVRNEGHISGLDDVFLVAHTVQNAGTISAGTVGLAAGAEIELRQAGAERLSVIAGNSKAQPGSADGVVNAGTIEAVSAELKAAGGNIYALAINNGGIVRATSIVRENGRILLRADRGTVVNSGTLDASSRTPGGRGGEVQVLGERVGLVGNSKIDVSGDAGGGTVLVGGDFQGRNPSVPNAQATLVGKNSTIKADAISSGDGGKVIVWSDEATRYLGSISARGAGNRGDGGFVEVSGKAGLAFDGSVDVSPSGAGAKGTVLLDPDRITVAASNPDIDGDGTSEGATDDIDDLADLSSAGNFGTVNSVITAGAVNALLTGNNSLVLAANLSITVGAAINGNAAGNASLTLNAPTISLNAPITLAGAGVLSGTPNQVNVNPGGSIQNGIDLVVAGGIVSVAAGSYAGNISVPKQLTLNGARAGVDARTRDTTSGESVINGQVRLLAPNITLDGFTVRDSTGGAGIVASDAAGDDILNNFITANVFGLSLASDGSAPIIVSQNFFKDNTLAGSASGNGIYTDFNVSDVLVSANRFEGHAEGSVTFLGAAPGAIFDIDIIGNVMDVDGPISIGNITDVTISRNVVSGNSGHALWVGGGATAVSITENALLGNGGAGLKFSRPGSSGIAAVSSGFDVTGNSFQGNIDGAIVIDVSEGSRYTGTLNASGNWWGDPSGPGVASVGFTGTGNAIVDTAGPNDRVDFSPWLNNGTDQQAGLPGFQGDFSVLNVSPRSPATIALVGIIDEALGLLSGANQRLQLFEGTYSDQTTFNIPVAVTLKGDVTLAGQNVTLASITGEGNDLTVNASLATIFNGTVSGVGALTTDAPGSTDVNSTVNAVSVTLNDVATLDGGTITTGDNQNYNAAVTLGAATTLTGDNVTLAAVTGGGNRLEINASQVTTFNGVVSSVGALITDAAGSTDINSTVNAVSVTLNDVATLDGGVITTTGSQTYNAAITLGANTVLNNSTVTFGATVNGGNRNLTLNSSGDVTLSGPSITDVAEFRTSAGGSTRLNGGEFEANTLINFGDSLVLGEGTSLTAPEVTLAAVSGAGAGEQRLDVNATLLTRFNGPISGVGALTTDAGGSTEINQTVSAVSVTFNDATTLSGGTITTSDNQNYNAAVTLGAGTTLSGDNVTFSGVTGGGNLLQINASQATTFNGVVSGVGALITDAAGSTDINASVNAVSVTLNDVATLDGATITTTDDQNYNAAITLGVGTTLSGDNVTFSGVTGGGNLLQINASQATTFNGVVIGVGALITDAAGSTDINASVNAVSVTLNDVATLDGATITTTDDQNYNAAITLGVGTTLSGDNVTFSGVMGGGNLLQINASQATTFNGVVSGVGALITDAAGSTDINASVNAVSVTLNDVATLDGGIITTADNQNYNAAVTLGVGTTLTGDNVTFAGLSGGANNGLRINASVATTFNGVVSGVGALITDAAGSTDINASVNAVSVTLNDVATLDGGIITTADNQNYNAAVTLGVGTTLTGDNVTFAGLSGGANNGLQINASQATTFNGVVSGVGALITDAAGSTDINASVNAVSVTLNDVATLDGGTIITDNDQTFNAAVTLGVGTTLSANSVTLVGVTGGGNRLQVSASQVTTFNGAIDGVGALITDAGGSTTINQSVNAGSVTLNDFANLNGGTITTGGGQGYNGAVTLVNNNQLNGSAITFGSTLTGSGRNLGVNAFSGDATFDGGVTLNNLNVTRAADVSFGANVNAARVDLGDVRNVFASGNSTVDTLNIVNATGNIEHVGVLSADDLLFCSLGEVRFTNPDNSIANVNANMVSWQADDGFLAVDQTTAQFIIGDARGTARGIPFDESFRRVVNALVPQLQLQEIQVPLSGVSSERAADLEGILTRTADVLLKATEALTRSGELSVGKSGN